MLPAFFLPQVCSLTSGLSLSFETIFVLRRFCFWGLGCSSAWLFQLRKPATDLLLCHISRIWQSPACILKKGHTRGFDEFGLKNERPSYDDLSKENLGIGLLSHTKVCSIMGDEELDCRVRNGIGYTLFSMDTKEI